MDWRQLLGILLDNNQDQNVHNEALLQLGKQEYDKNNIPERIQQELDIASTVAQRTKDNKDLLHQEVLRYISADRQQFISLMAASCSTRLNNPIKTMAYNLVIDSDELQTTIPATMNGPINAAFQAQVKFNELEMQPRTQRDTHAVLEQRERGEATQFMQAKWSEERRKKYHLWLQSVMPVPYYHSFLSKDMTTTVQNMFNLAELVAQNMVRITVFDDEQAVANWAEYRTSAFSASGRRVQSLFVVPATSNCDAQEKNAIIERISTQFIASVEQTFGINPNVFQNVAE